MTEPAPHSIRRHPLLADGRRLEAILENMYAQIQRVMHRGLRPERRPVPGAGGRERILVGGEAAIDVLQEALLGLLSYDPAQLNTTWEALSVTIARNKAIAAVREATKGRHGRGAEAQELGVVSLDAEASSESLPSGSATALVDRLASEQDPQDEFERIQQQLVIIRVAGQILSDRDRRIFFDVHFRGVSRAEVGRQLDLSGQGVGRISAPPPNGSSGKPVWIQHFLPSLNPTKGGLMTDHDDPLDAVISGFLDHLEGEGELPSLDHLTPGERVRAVELIASLKAGRGIDPYASRPSIEELLADTPYEEALGAASSRELAAGLDEQIVAQLAHLSARVFADRAATGIPGVRSDCVVLVQGVRLRVQVHEELSGPAQLASLDVSEAAGPIYGRFPDTAGVVLLYPDGDLSSVIVDPFDLEYCIETPSGTVGSPGTRRVVMPLRDAVQSYLEEVAPTLDVLPGPSAPPDPFDLAVLAQQVAAAAVRAVASEGTRARIAAKRDTWSALGDAEIEAITQLVLAGMNLPLSREALEERISAVADAA